MTLNDGNLISVLNKGGVVVMPTDTIYGIVGSALDAFTVLRIYKIRKRAPEKPCIVLIGGVSELEKFSINLSDKQKEIIKEYWNFNSPATSIILDCEDEAFSYLHRGTKTLAFRLPAQKELQDLLKKTRPLIAPSANLEGMTPARNIKDAKGYFGDNVDLYFDGGEVEGKASKIIRLNKDGTVTTIRN